MQTDPVNTLSGFADVDDLEERLSRPTPEVIGGLSQLGGDLMILGVGGKMGPTLAMLARRAMDAGESSQRVVGVARFSDPALAEKLQRAGVQTVACDLMAQGALDALPDAQNVIYMVGTKFGAWGQEPRTWAVNAFLSGRVVQRFHRSRIVVFSSGNVYAFAPVMHGGSVEQASPSPVGEYAQSVLGRERIFQYFGAELGVPTVLFRLNYAVETRYGVLLDVARKVWVGEPVDLSMGHVNVIWQGDANGYALRALSLARVPPLALNVTGPETISVRWLAQQFGDLLGRRPILEGQEQETALLSNAGQAFKLMGYPSTPLGQVIEWVAKWVVDGGPVLDKPTKFQVRDGKF